VKERRRYKKSGQNDHSQKEQPSDFLGQIFMIVVQSERLAFSA
jgi:hypothetical protein